jgi:hypothetical protein
VLLKLYDIPSATILSYAIALQVVMFVTIPTIAMVLGWRLGILQGLGFAKKTLIYLPINPTQLILRLSLKIGLSESFGDMGFVPQLSLHYLGYEDSRICGSV